MPVVSETLNGCVGEVVSLERENKVLAGLVVRLSIAAIDPGEFGSSAVYVGELVGFMEIGQKADGEEEPVDEEEIDTLTSVLVEALEFEDDE